MPEVTTMLEQAPLPEILKNLVLSIGEAQFDIDKKAFDILQLMADEENGVQLPDEDQKRSMLELGFSPSFYHVTEANIETKVAFSSSKTTEWGMSASVGISVPIKMVMLSASFSASYSQKYSFSAEGASSINARVVAVPPPQPISTLLLTKQNNRIAEEHSANKSAP